ncbi:MAG: hypothetical protein WCF01_01325 [Nitrososphaeraceae archaeon]
MIEWDQVITENIILAGIIYFAVYLEQWIHMRSERQLERKTAKNVIIFIKDDLEQRLRFIEECNQYGDYKPFFTDMWDSVVFAGKHTLISFELFQTIQRTYSWMKYYNAELEMNTKYKSPDEKVLKELLGDVERSIHKSIEKLEKTELDIGKK